MEFYIDTENGKIITEDDLRIEEVSVDPSAYVGYEIHECAQRPTDTGRYVGKTPVLAQALEACLRAKEHGGSYFIYGIKKTVQKYCFCNRRLNHVYFQRQRKTVPENLGL